jgi:hypothetical protein
MDDKIRIPDRDGSGEDMDRDWIGMNEWRWMTGDGSRERHDK